MIITCEQCNTQYYLASNRIKATGSKVKCSKCHHVFVALLPTDDETGVQTVENDENRTPEKDVEPEEAQAAVQAKATGTPDIEMQALKVTTEPSNTVIAAGKLTGPGKFETLPGQRTGKWLIVPLIIILLLALLLGINAMGVRIPYISDLNIPFISGIGQQSVNDPGNTRIKTVDIESKFVTNGKSGRLYVITGKVLNQYDNTREFIQIKGDIYADGGELIETKSVHCGNILSDMDLIAKPFADIQRYLTDKLGAGGDRTLKVGPKKTLPFMIVFAGLPPDIEEFSVEVICSAAL